MSIQYAILGLLGCGSYSGYDLKKIIQESAFLPWSGNNNQIYKALTELVEEGCATSEVVHRDGAPSKKTYSITARGEEELRRWLMTPPEAPEFAKPFLVQLAWADRLNDDELERLTAAYADELRLRLALLLEAKRRGGFAPARTAREALIWDHIHDNIISSCRQELAWLERLRAELGLDDAKETSGMHVFKNEKDGIAYLEAAESGAPIRGEREAMAVVEACIEHNVFRVLLHGGALADDFFELKNGIAGAVLQKFVNYTVKAALLMPETFVVKGRAKELLTELNRGQAFRTFTDRDAALGWLLADA